MTTMTKTNGINKPAMLGKEKKMTGTEMLMPRKKKKKTTTETNRINKPQLKIVQLLILLVLVCQLEVITTNSVAGVTAGQIVDGYTFMLVVLHQLFDVPLEFWESGQPGTWHPQWENHGPIKDGEVAEHPFVKTI